MGYTDVTRGVVCSVAPGPACASHVCGGYAHGTRDRGDLPPYYHCTIATYLYHATGARLNHGRRNLSFPSHGSPHPHPLLTSLHRAQTGLARAPPRTSAQPRTRKKHPPPPPAITLQFPATPYDHLHARSLPLQKKISAAPLSHCRRPTLECSPQPNLTPDYVFLAAPLPCAKPIRSSAPLPSDERPRIRRRRPSSRRHDPARRLLHPARGARAPGLVRRLHPDGVWPAHRVRVVRRRREHRPALRRLRWPQPVDRCARFQVEHVDDHGRHVPCW
jgi:hypothetical protein